MYFIHVYVCGTIPSGFFVFCFVSTHMIDPSTLSKACPSVFRSFGFPKSVSGTIPYGFFVLRFDTHD